MTEPQSSHSPRDLLRNAAVFVTGQTSCFRRALLDDDAMTTAVVLGVHNRSHPRWLSLAAAARACVSPAAAREVVALYTLHGRLAASLERRTLKMLPRHVRVEARSVMLDDLDALAARVLEHCADAPLATAGGVHSR